MRREKLCRDIFLRECNSIGRQIDFLHLRQSGKKIDHFPEFRVEDSFASGNLQGIERLFSFNQTEDVALELAERQKAIPFGITVTDCARKIAGVGDLYEDGAGLIFILVGE